MRKNGKISTGDIARLYILPNYIRKISHKYKIMGGFNTFISENSIHSQLLAWRRQ